MQTFTAVATTPNRPKAQYGHHNAGWTSAGSCWWGGRGADKAQALHSKAEMGSLTARCRAKVSCFSWKLVVFVC